MTGISKWIAKHFSWTSWGKYSLYVEAKNRWKQLVESK